MAVPKKKTSKARRNKRRSHHALTKTNLVACPQCQEMRLPHTVCSNCGYYKGRQVLQGEES